MAHRPRYAEHVDGTLVATPAGIENGALARLIRRRRRYARVLQRRLTAGLLDPLSKVGRYAFLTGTTALAAYIGVRILLDPGVEAVMWGIYGFVVAASLGYVGILIADWFVSRVCGWLRRAS